jgi:hypothetical protein
MAHESETIRAKLAEGPSHSMGAEVKSSKPHLPFDVALAGVDGNRVYEG